LDTKYYGVIEIYGDLSKASISNPVPSAIVEYIAITQELRTLTQNRSYRNSCRVLDEKLHATVK